MLPHCLSDFRAKFTLLLVFGIAIGVFACPGRRMIDARTPRRIKSINYQHIGHGILNRLATIR
jgi:hypothetical protein